MSENFIGVYDAVVSKEFCRGIIEFFEWSAETGRTWERKETRPRYKKDDSTTINPLNQFEIQFTRDHLGAYLEEFNTAFWENVYPDYAERFDILNTLDPHSIVTYKVQKTLPGGGYHVWHCEHSGRSYAQRLGTYVLYLNDVPEGGETELLYQHERVEAREGRLVVFPASWTHTHRGNPPLRGAKYIMTGWLEYT